MPTWDEILNELKASNPQNLLDKYIERLNKLTGRTIICYMSAFSIIKPPVPSPYHMIINQDIQGFMTCSEGVDKEALDLILHIPGGDSEATKRIVYYLHQTYKHIRVFIPHMAMSGGTIIACAADEIYMGPYSSLGPTDPQIFLAGKFIPVQAIINEFDMAFDEVSKNPRRALLWNERLKQIPFGQIKAARTMMENSLKYLVELLQKRNCQNKSLGDIKKIANFLNSHEKYSSHGEGITLDDIKDKLTAKDLSKDKDLEDAVLSIYHSAIILFERTIAQKIVINNHKRRYINNYSPR